MNKQICIFILLLTCRICNAQNLIPNGDFEQFTSCPTSSNQLNKTLNWINPHVIWSPPGGTPDYFNACAPQGLFCSVPYNSGSSYQPAHSGDAYVGIGLWQYTSTWREYIEVPLTSTLTLNDCYHFEMYVNLGNNSKYAIDTIGVYFSNTIVSSINMSVLPFTPQIKNAGFITDTLNWTLITADYTASGGENYLIIGNFNDDATTNTLQLGGVSGTGGTYYYMDDVSLTPCTTGIDETAENALLNIAPSPFSDKLNISINNSELLELILYDITSRKIFNQSFTNSTTINTAQLAKGIYLYEVRNKSGVIKKGKVVKE